MPGLRIQHPTERNTAYTLVDGARPYRRPLMCPPPPQGCGSVHAFKTYHIRLDETGAAIVSFEIAERLGRIRGHGLVLTNEVASPPAQRVVATVHSLVARVERP